MDDASHVEVEEVGVEDGLDDSGDDDDWVEVIFSIVAVDPVEDVQSTVWSKSEQVMSGDDLKMKSEETETNEMFYCREIQ